MPSNVKAKAFNYRWLVASENFTLKCMLNSWFYSTYSPKIRPQKYFWHFCQFYVLFTEKQFSLGLTICRGHHVQRKMVW